MDDDSTERVRPTARQTWAGVFTLMVLLAVLGGLLYVSPAVRPAEQARAIRESAAAGAPSASPSAAPDPADERLLATCSSFFEDPDYSASLFFEVQASADGEASDLDRDVAQRVRDLDPDLDVLDTVARGAVGEVPGEDLNAALTSLADMCGAAGNETAQHAMGTDTPKTKPASMVCADVLSRPQTLGAFGNANVVPSNLFKVVGLGPAWVGDLDLAGAVHAELSSQMDASADPHLSELIGGIRQPLDDALNGDRNSPGIRQPLDELTAYCDGLRAD